MNLAKSVHQGFKGRSVALENVPIKLKQTTGSSKLTANNNKINRKTNNKNRPTLHTTKRQQLYSNYYYTLVRSTLKPGQPS